MLTSSTRTAAIFDLDRTVVDVDTLPFFLLRVLRSRVDRWTAAPKLLFAALLRYSGARDHTWLKEYFLRVICGGHTPDDLDTEIGSIVAGLRERHLRPGAVKALESHRESGHLLILATASPDIYVLVLADELGFDAVVCTRTERDAENRLTGRLDGGNCYGPEKLRRIQAEFGEQREVWTIISYSDHRTDFELLQWSDRGFAVNPDRTSRREAVAAGIPVLDWGP